MKYSHLMIALPLLALCGCSYDRWSYKAVPDVAVSRPDELSNEGSLVLKLEPATTALDTPAMRQWLHDHPDAAGKRTVLMASRIHESAFYSFTMGQTLVIFLEGPPKPGEYWLNPDNAVLITYSAYSAPEQERVALVGSITIDKVGDKEINARLAVRDTTQIDTSLFLDRPWDPLNRQWPYVLRGNFTFQVTQPNDPLFEKSAVKWISQSDSKTKTGPEF